MAGTCEVARKHLNMAVLCQKQNYDKHLAGKPFSVGDSVRLLNVQRRKERNDKLNCPWKGLYLVVSALSDGVYRIEKTAKAKPKVIHSDPLKPYLGPCWSAGFQNSNCQILGRRGRVREYKE